MSPKSLGYRQIPEIGTLNSSQAHETIPLLRALHVEEGTDKGSKNGR